MARKKAELNEDIETLEASIDKLTASLKKSKVVGLPDLELFDATRLETNTSGLSTGSPAVDVMLKRPIPVGIHELFGPYGSGKTTMALHICANAQKKGLPTFYINLERALNKEVLACISGLDSSKLRIINPVTGNQATEFALDVFRTIQSPVVILDSVAGCAATENVHDKSMSEQTMGELGKLMSVFLAKAVPLVDDSGGRLILINQVRDKLNMYVAGHTSPGGRGLEHWTTQRLMFSGGLSKTSYIEEGSKDDSKDDSKDSPKNGSKKSSKNGSTKYIGKKIDVTAIKNRLGFPLMEAEMFIYFGRGIWKEKEIVKLATELGVVDKGGSWYSYKGENIAQGEDKLFEHIRNTNGLYDEIKSKVYELTGLSNEI